jgi:uncharacterized delta-60 repeat protein
MTSRPRALGRTILVAVVAVLAFASTAIAATPGSLDPSFAGGVASAASGTQLFGVAVQSNGVVVAAGQSGGSVLVQRFTSAGALAGTYVGGGGVAQAAAAQPDGKVVVAGSSGGMFAERFNADGSVDSSFGSGGVARVPALGSSAVAYGVAVAPGGKIVVAGTIGGPDTRIAVARFNANGTLDTSFGSGGSLQLDLGLPYEAAQGVAVQPDGKVVLVGREQGSTTYEFFNGLIIRLNTNGGLDGSFAGSGVVSYHDQHVSSGYDALNAVAIQTDGKIVAAGSSVGGPYAVFLRLNTNGSYDSTFASAGEADLSAGTFTSIPTGAYGVVIGGGGRVIGAGAVQNNGTDPRAGLWGLSSAGAADSSVGPGGLTEPQSGSEACGMTIQPDGNLLVAGSTVSPTATQRPPCTAPSSGFLPTGFVARYIGFGPPPTGLAPTAVTGPAGSVTASSATVTGSVNPGGLLTSYEVQYGPTTAYGTTSTAVSAGSGSAAVSVSIGLAALAPGTTYHYRLVATNADGTVNGSDATFTTSTATGPPTVVTGSATPAEFGATLSGQVGSGGLATTYLVQYGRSNKLGSSTKAVALPAPAGSVSVKLAGLKAKTGYWYRFVATNTLGSADGSKRQFKTLAPLVSSVKGLSPSYTISTVRSGGLPAQVSCSRACRLTGSIRVSRAISRSLNLGTHTLIGSGSKTIRRHGTVKLILRLTKGANAALAHSHGLSALVAIVIKPTQGGASVTHRVTVHLNL